MNSIYKVEEEKELFKFTFPKFSEPCIKNTKLTLDTKSSKYNISKKIFTNGAYYLLLDSTLILPNGETFIGLLTEDFTLLRKGTYTWPNGQKYYGNFNENNKIHTPDKELSKLTFSNGDIFEGVIQNGKCLEGKYKTKNGKEVKGEFTDGLINGYLVISDPKKCFKFKGYLIDSKKEGLCETEIKIDNKIYKITGEYIDGLKDGKFEIYEIAPIQNNLYIKGKYRKGQRHGYFDIIDNEKGINIKHQYISFLQEKLINDYNKKYKDYITGNEISLSYNCHNNPVKRLTNLFQIRFGNLLNLEITRAKLQNLSFLITEDKTLFSLQNLNLSNNSISSIEPLIDVYYPNLKKLILNDNKIKDILCIQNFKFEKLEELNLSCNPIESLEGIDNWKFPNLFHLSLNKTKIKDITPMFDSDFPLLAQIDLYNNKLNNNKRIKPELFSKCTSLKNIVLERIY